MLPGVTLQYMGVIQACSHRGCLLVTGSTEVVALGLLWQRSLVQACSSGGHCLWPVSVDVPDLGLPPEEVPDLGLVPQSSLDQACSLGRP